MQFLLDFYVMPHTRFSIRLDFANGNGIGPGKIALLEAIQAQGSIGWAARHVGMCYRQAWLLVQDINNTPQQPAVITAGGGPNGSNGARVTPVGKEVVKRYRWIEDATHMSAHHERLAIGRHVRRK
jgi:molybdate transport system regulatory protein